MKRFSLFSMALLIGLAFCFNPASAQFPKIKIPKPGQIKPTPTPDEDSGTTTTPDVRGSTRSPGGGPYATRFTPTDTPLFLAETLEIRTDTQDYYWKLPKESNYTSWTPH